MLLQTLQCSSGTTDGADSAFGGTAVKCVFSHLCPCQSLAILTSRDQAGHTLGSNPSVSMSIAEDFHATKNWPFFSS